MITSLLSGATLQVVPHQGVVFLQPARPRREGNEEDGPLLYGHVILSLPRPRYMEKIVVRHVTNYSISLPGRDLERGKLQEEATEIAIFSRLEKGEHRFPWSLQLPSTTLPYERNMYGRVTHQLLTSAPGVGFLGNNLEASARVKFVMNRSQDVQDPFEERRMEGFLDDLGAYCVTLKSPHMTVGGLVQVSVKLPCAPQEIRVRSITLRVWQTFKITSPGGRHPPSHTPLQTITFMVLNHGTARKHPTVNSQPEADVIFTPNSRPHPSENELLVVVPEGESLDMTFLTRWPRDNELRATIAEGDSPNHPMCISHELRAEIRYWTPGSNERLARFAQPIEFASCCCLTESMTLPCYSRHDSISDESQGVLGAQNIDRALAQCACEISTEDLLKVYGREAFEVRAPVTVIEAEQERPKAVYVPTSGSGSAEGT